MIVPLQPSGAVQVLVTVELPQEVVAVVSSKETLKATPHPFVAVTFGTTGKFNPQDTFALEGIPLKVATAPPSIVISCVAISSFPQASIALHVLVITALPQSPFAVVSVKATV